MESLPPLPTDPGHGQRTLAAIVFTDVVAFSARMQVDEELVLSLLERDFTVMRKLCQQHSGTVLKTTGDGLLLYFPSAVQAVGFALRMQQYFGAKSKTLPSSEFLAHRVGIHLGDVFLQAKDIMGDGVNIAARLPAEAEPGGICISQTVYDVVKNKLALQVTLLGPRELKNISESIPIYRILLEAQALQPDPDGADPAATPAPGGTSSRPAPVAGKRRSRRWLVVGGLVLIGVLLALALPGWRESYRIKQERARIESARGALQDLLESSRSREGGYDPQEMVRVLAAWREELRGNRSHSFDENDVSKLEAALTPARLGALPKNDAALRRLALARLKGLLAWMDPAIKRYSKEHPLITSELAGAELRQIEIFAGRNPGLYMVEGGAVRLRNWATLKPAQYAAIVMGTLLDAPSPPPAEVVQGVEIYAWLYNLPELESALRH